MNEIERIAIENVRIPLSVAEELEELKIDDPDAYLEAKKEAVKAAQADLQAKFDAAKKVTNAEKLQAVIDGFKDKSGVDMTPEVIANHIPPFLKKEWEKGSISDEDFVKQAANVIKAVKRPADNTSAVMPNIGDAGTADGADGGTPKVSPSDAYASNKLIY